ncbi:MAG TPA: DNA primase [Dehalococcoidia bacterium]|nr:DNA primase [Dehalococcoidia bacterium]
MNSIEEVKSRLDIVDVVSQYVQLQKSGRNLKGLCPFHSEKTPSFYVSPERQSWHCFGACGTGGDVLSFVMRKEGLDFPQALHMLADRAGVRLPERREEAEDSDERKRLREANAAAARYYHDLLLHGESATAARSYLERRGVTVPWQQEFSLGYSPAGWEELRGHLHRQGFSDTELLQAGLLVQGEKSPYDRFRGRLMFPIRDSRGRVIGFGARALDDSTPKYLNTAQSPLFDKGSEFYALDRAREAIRREHRAVIVEGYMDVIAAHQHGFANVVATMGTALTERQVRVLKRYTTNIVLALDADAAGGEAALRGQAVIEETLAQDGDKQAVPVLTWRGLVRYQEAASVTLHVVELPAGKDPDELIRSDAEAWRIAVENARPALDYKFDGIAARTEGAGPQERSVAVRELLPLVGAIGDPVVRAHYLQRLARLALVREEEIAGMLPRGTRSGPSKAAAVAQPATRDNREEFLLALLLHYPALREQAASVRPDLFWRSENRQVLAAVQIAEDFADLYVSLAPELHEHIDRLLASHTRILEEFDDTAATRAFENAINRLEARQRDFQKQGRTAMLAEREQQLEDKLPLTEEADRAFRSGKTEAGVGPALSEIAALYFQDAEEGRRLHGVSLATAIQESTEEESEKTEVIPE